MLCCISMPGCYEFLIPSGVEMISGAPGAEEEAAPPSLSGGRTASGLQRRGLSAPITEMSGNKVSYTPRRPRRGRSSAGSGRKAEGLT